MPAISTINADPISPRDYWREFLKYRSLIWIFAWQEIKSQYAQTYFGVFWAVLRPLIILSIFTVLFGFLLHIHTTSPYILFAFTGMIAWNFFSQIAANASVAISTRKDLISKMYFPKIILPLSKTVVAGVETLVSFMMFFVLMLILGFPLSLHIISLPFFIFLNICLGLGIAIWMTVLNIRNRDLHQIVIPIIGMGIWFTPVFFPTTIIPEQYQCLLYLNPMAGIIAGYRYALLGDALPGLYFWISFVVVIVVFVMGVISLVRVEDEIVDCA
jgi:lipopolysaccharide transport system permease protein